MFIYTASTGWQKLDKKPDPHNKDMDERPRGWANTTHINSMFDAENKSYANYMRDHAEHSAHSRAALWRSGAVVDSGFGPLPPHLESVPHQYRAGYGAY